MNDILKLSQKKSRNSWLKKDFSRLATGESEENTELELKALALIHNLANLPVQHEYPLFRETYEKLAKKGTVFPEKTQEDLVPVFTPKQRTDTIPPKLRREINEIKESLNVVIEILTASKNQTHQEIEVLKELIDLLRKGQNNLLKYIQENETTLGETGVNEILTLHGRIDSAIVKYEEMKSEPPLVTTRSGSVQSTPLVTEIPAHVSTQSSTTSDDDIFSSFVGERVAKLSIHPPPPAGSPIRKPIPMSFMVAPAPAPALNLNQIPMTTTTNNYPPLPIPPQMNQPNPNLYPQNFIPSNTIPMGTNIQKHTGYVPLVPMAPMIPTPGTSFPKTSTTNTTTNGTKNNDAKPVWLEFDPLANK